ncbi:isocitrate/isopropylmalate dehydrogenase [Colletotrichum tofieldiae]|nr:isocitrate/isopropylmalate dehydrogenase [Colletotrichum tofieldiae]GKT75054.1 isocitrate/isopropylmalate dehydrogenase [Colletotrichum tofieldiae]
MSYYIAVYNVLKPSFINAPYQKEQMASSTGIPSSPGNASKGISLRSLWPVTRSNLARLFRVNLGRGPPSSVGKSRSSGPDSAIRFEISLPRQPECASPRRWNKNVLVAVVCPPVAVYRTGHDLNAKVWLTVALTLGGWIPGVVCMCGRRRRLEVM